MTPGAAPPWHTQTIPDAASASANAARRSRQARSPTHSLMNEPTVGAKLLLSYDINMEDDTNAYFRFFLGRYIPVMQALGMEVSEAWHTAYGDYPNRLVGFVTRDMRQALALPQNENWLQLNQELMTFVTNFSYKIIPYQEGFQF